MRESKMTEARRTKDDKELIKLEAALANKKEELASLEARRSGYSANVTAAQKAFDDAQAAYDLGEASDKDIATAESSLAKAEKEQHDCEIRCKGKRGSVRLLGERVEAKREAVQQRVDSYYRKQLNDGVTETARALVAFVEANGRLASVEADARNYSTLNLANAQIAYPGTLVGPGAERVTSISLSLSQLETWVRDRIKEGYNIPISEFARGACEWL